MNHNIILSLYQKPQTVFTMREIALMFPQISYDNLKKRMSYHAKSGSIRRLSRGVYAKEEYNELELANRLYFPSYVSLETVLRQAGVIFQHHETITAVSYISREIEADGHRFRYRKIKSEILLNKKGVDSREQITVASPERAFLDAVYLYKNYHFDNLDLLDWEKIKRTKEIYDSRKLLDGVEEYYQIYQEESRLVVK